MSSYRYLKATYLLKNYSILKTIESCFKLVLRYKVDTVKPLYYTTINTINVKKSTCLIFKVPTINILVPIADKSLYS